jgi:hypothetical protein
MTLSQHSVPLTAAQRKVVAGLLPELSDRLDLSKKNPVRSLSRSKNSKPFSRRLSRPFAMPKPA